MRHIKLVGVILLFGIACWFAWQMWGLRSNSLVPTLAASATHVPEPIAEDGGEMPDDEREAEAWQENHPEETAYEEEDWRDDLAIGTSRLEIRADAATPVAPEEELRQAMAALVRNDLSEAARHFSTLAAQEPRHREALLGLAEIALRRGNVQAAYAHYQAARTAYPQDARVEAGMIALLAESGEIETEILASRLRRLIAEQPDVAAPYFVLGNLLARERMWREAETAYFAAYRLESGNPDYRFNLAVSLDALRQSGLAAEHYHAALLAAEAAPAAFDRGIAQRRLAALAAKAKGEMP